MSRASVQEIWEMAERLGVDRPEVRSYLAWAKRGYAEQAGRGLERLLRDEGHDPDGPPEPFEPWPTAAELFVEGGLEIANEHHTSFSTYLDVEKEVSRGVLAAGAHGSGKTTLGFWLAEGLRDYGTIVGFDTPRRDWSGFARRLGMRYLRQKHCRFNPLQPPPSTPVTGWFPEVSSAFAVAYYLLGASTIFMVNRAMETLRRVGAAGRFPIFRDLLHTYRDFRPSGKGRAEHEYLSRTLPKLEMLEFLYGDQLGCEIGFDLAALTDVGQGFFLELPQSEEVRSFMVLWLLLWLFHFRIDNPHLPRHPVFILLDEARHLMQARDTEGSGDIVGKLIVMLRGVGISLVIMTQTPTDLSVAARSNLGVVFTMRNQDVQVGCCRQIQRLTREQEDVIVHLAPGQAIVTVLSRVKRPVLVDIPPYPALAVPTEQELDELSARSVADLVGRVKEAPHPPSPVPVQVARTNPNELSDDERPCLRAIVEHPETLARRCARLAWDSNREYEARRKLEKRGHVQLEGTVGNRKAIYGPTPKGQAVGRREGWQLPSFKSGWLHEAARLEVKMQIANSVNGVRLFDKGFADVLGGLEPDITLRFAGGQLGVVQVCDRNRAAYECERLVRLAGIEAVDLVISVAVNRETKEKLERELTGRIGKAWPGKLILRDVEQCLSTGDWSWIMERET